MWSSQLSKFSSTVPRELVHRSSIGEVFLTGYEQTGAGKFRVNVQWPRWHVFYDLECNSLDSALLVETMRQATILIAHCGYDVPLEHKFLMPNLSLAKSAVGFMDLLVPPEVVLEVEVITLSVRGNGTIQLQAQAAFTHEGKVLATADAGARTVDPITYTRLRGVRPSVIHRPAHPVHSFAAGVISERNVVLGESDSVDSWPIIADQSHPILFDHPLDHVPGVLLIEAARQACRLAAGTPALDTTALSGCFKGIVEHGEALRACVRSLVRQSDGRVNASVSMDVGDTSKARFELVLEPRSSRPAPRED